MAEEKNSEEQAPAKGKKKLLLFIVIGVLVLVLAGGVGAFLLLKKKPIEDGDEEAAAETTHDAKKEASGQPPVYVKLETFTTNLAMEDPTTPQTGQYVQAVVELKVSDALDSESIKQYMPEIRNGILRLLSSKKASQLTSAEGMDALAGEIRDIVNGIIPGSSKKSGKGGARSGPVLTALFSSFIIQ
jgi:flagellar FliL protein